MSTPNWAARLAASFVVACTGTSLCSSIASASSDAVRNQLARTDCVRGKFKDYYLQDQGGNPPVSYKGRVFKLSQNYPNQLPPKENYPWLKIPFKDGGPVDARAYLQAMLDYGLEGNIEVDFYVEDNKTRRWYGAPWMDWNTEVASDWPGTDGREYIHGLTHEFDSAGNTFGEAQVGFVDTWAQAYMNDRYGFGLGQVYCDPDDPKPGALNPDPTGLNTFPDGSFVIKLLFSTVSEAELPTVKGAFEWDANIYINKDPQFRNAGPLSRFERRTEKVRLIQIDLQVRDERSTTGWLLGTYGYNGNAKGDTPWKRMVPLGLQWGNNPKVTFAETCAGPNGPCDYDKLTEQWINRQAVVDLATPPLNFNHLGYGGRLAGPVDNPKSSCMGCHQTAGFPTVPILAEFAPNGSILKLDAQKHPETAQSLRMMYFGNVPGGAVFSDTQLYSADYSLQLAMGLQNFVSLRCAANASGPRPSLCDELANWVRLQQSALSALQTFGTPGPGGAPIKP
ncbi:hypothetical protein [Hyphomicrobium methylovorum]|uniref:hypothetical protein n=1 Tax=Hyphomicrobium methylovorum TaxID=84 RepID=UPI001FE59C3F|nr:hypothetical protein [Hyphomicrobium methylovorum]